MSYNKDQYKKKEIAKVGQIGVKGENRERGVRAKTFDVNRIKLMSDR